MRDIRSAELVLPCTELDPTLRFFCERLHFVLRSIRPADRPRQAVVEGHGLRICLRVGDPGDPGALRLQVAAAAELPPAAERTLTAPNGTRIELYATGAPIELPPLRPELVVTHRPADDAWPTGRAGMRYRDLIPGRQGGRFIASHILIEAGGPVPDYPHHHGVHFQMIYCHRGQVKLVYEDQGPPFVMRAGDAVLQPPGILHRVLECSPGLEVVEIGCPAEHDTFAEAGRALPTDDVRPGRLFGGQRFVWHQAEAATWHDWRHPGFSCRDTGIAAATDGIASARIVRAAGGDHVPESTGDRELLFLFVTAGRATLVAGAEPEPLRAGSAVTIPAGQVFALRDGSADLAFLEVGLPGIA